MNLHSRNLKRLPTKGLDSKPFTTDSKISYISSLKSSRAAIVSNLSKLVTSGKLNWRLLSNSKNAYHIALHQSHSGSIVLSELRRVKLSFKSSWKIFKSASNVHGSALLL